MYFCGILQNFYPSHVKYTHYPVRFFPLTPPTVSKLEPLYFTRYFYIYTADLKGVHACFHDFYFLKFFTTLHDSCVE
jgi:hypothetical protein